MWLASIPYIGVFGATGDETTSKVTPTTVKEEVAGKKEDEKKISKLLPKKIETQEKEDENTSVGEINKAIIQLYKLQGNKILSELETSFEEFYEDDATRAKAYRQIQSTYINLKKKSQSSDTSDNTKKILSAYFDYMISMLEKKIEELTK